MRVLVTGATGKVGYAIASASLARGDQVRALVRDSKRAATILPAGIEQIEGDATDADSLAAAVEGCELVFNAMGMPEQWVKDEGIFDRVNAQGSGALAAAAKRAGVRRFVHTSTHDVFHAETGDSFDETMVADYPKGTAYERSKQHAEQLVLAERDGMEIVILNPSGVYGPTPSPTPSFENEVFEPVVRRGFRRSPRAARATPSSRAWPRATCWPPTRAGTASATSWPTGTRTSESWPRRPSESPAAGASRRGCRCPVAKAVASLGAGLSRVTRRPPLLPRGTAHLHPLAGAPGLLEGSAGARVADDPPRPRASARRSTRWASCDAA